jgi:hypothetical protein
MFLFLSVEYKYMPDFYQNQALHQLPKYTADMAPKRPIEDDAVAPQSKKHQTTYQTEHTEGKASARDLCTKTKS